MDTVTLKTLAALYLLICLASAHGASAQGQTSPETSPENPPPAATPEEAPVTPSQAAEGNSTINKLCDLPELATGAWIDRMHRAVYRSVCGSALWFDHFFGDEDFDDQNHEQQSTFGRLGGVLLWSEHDQLNLRGRLKVKLYLPRFEKRVNAFFGNYKEDEFARDRARNFGSLPEIFRDTTDREWLVGLGYRPAPGKRQNVDVDAGVKLGFPVDPFVRVRYRRYTFIHEAILLRFRQTLFWRGEKGLGTTSHLDFERALSPKFHLRWRTLGTLAEAIEGVDWESGFTVYHYLGEKRAIAYEARIDGETDADVTVDEYGFRAIYRQSVMRDWFFLELRAALTWPLAEVHEERQKSIGVGVGFELLFGQHP